MSDMYADLAATAESLITEFGQPATLVRTPAGTFDPITGLTVDGEGDPVVDVEYPCNALEQDVNSIAMFAASLRDGSLISESTRFFMLSGAVPQPNDKLVIGAATYVVDAARPLSPGATALYYTVRVRA